MIAGAEKNKAGCARRRLGKVPEDSGSNPDISTESNRETTLSSLPVFCSWCGLTARAAHQAARRPHRHQRSPNLTASHSEPESRAPRQRCRCANPCRLWPYLEFQVLRATVISPRSRRGVRSDDRMLFRPHTVTKYIQSFSAVTGRTGAIGEVGGVGARVAGGHREKAGLGWCGWRG